MATNDPPRPDQKEVTVLVTFLTRGFSTTGHAGRWRGCAEIAGAVRVLVSVLLVSTTVRPPSSGRRAPEVARLQWRPSAPRVVRSASRAQSSSPAPGDRALGTFGLSSGILADAEVAEKEFAVGYYRALAREAAAARATAGVRGRSGG